MQPNLKKKKKTHAAKTKMINTTWIKESFSFIFEA